jgi:hypothetical protein
MARPFSELTAGLSHERRVRIDARKVELVAQIDRRRGKADDAPAG